MPALIPVDLLNVPCALLPGSDASEVTSLDSVETPVPAAEEDTDQKRSEDYQTKNGPGKQTTQQSNDGRGFIFSKLSGKLGCR